MNPLRRNRTIKSATRNYNKFNVYTSQPNQTDNDEVLQKRKRVNE